MPVPRGLAPTAATPADGCPHANTTARGDLP
jgi:hypothetical protein